MDNSKSIKEKVRLLIRQGHGRAVLMLRDMSDEERHEYVDMVTDAIREDLRYDRQCNADRTEYNGFLVDSFTGADGEKLRRVYESVTAEKENKCAEDEEHSTHRGKPLVESLDKLTIGQIIGMVRESGENIVHPARFRRFFGKEASSEDIEALACAARNEADPLIKARLYSLFSCAELPFEPHEPHELIDMAKAWEVHLADEYGSNYVTAFNLQYALANLRHPEVREYGFDLIERALKAESDEKKAGLLLYGFTIWAANYEESDLKRLIEFNENLPEHDSDTCGMRHNVEFAITHKMFERKYEDPRTYEALVWVYDNTLCSCCRRKAVEILSDHGMLIETVRRCSLFDCDPETRLIAQEREVI